MTKIEIHSESAYTYDNNFCRFRLLFDDLDSFMSGGFIYVNQTKKLYFYHTDHTTTLLSTGFDSTSWATPYTFSGKEKDSETGYSYFGARYYDSGMSVWLSVDPMAGEYPSMSPFMYTAGNPVMLVDPDGKRIWVFTKNGQKLKYKDNKLYQRNGLFKWKEYEGDDKDATDILDHLNHLKNNEDKVISEALNTLENSRKNIKIRHSNKYHHTRIGPFKNGFMSDLLKYLAKKGMKLSSTIKYNSSEHDHGLVVLSHEIKHSLDINNGTLSNLYIHTVISGVGSREIPQREIDAVNFENRIRAQLYPSSSPNHKRTTYDTKGGRIPIPEELLNNY